MSVRFVGVVVALALACPLTALAAGPELPVKAYMLVDPATKAVVASRAADERRPIASITKLMTAYVVIRSRPDLTRVVRVPASAVVGESNVGLRAGDEITIGKLLEALLVPSANDAAITLAVATAGSEAAFVRRMNQTARRLGMRRTVYRNPHGLDQAGHLSTARDQLRLLGVVRQRAIVRRLAKQTSFTIDGRRYAATDTLFGRYAGFEGGKTGHTSGAGWSLVGTAARNGVRLDGIVLGATAEEDRDPSFATLLDWGFRKYHRVEMVRRKQVIGVVPATDGSTVNAQAAAPISVLVGPGRRYRLRVELADQVAPPIDRGAALGAVVVLDGEREVARAALVSDRAVAVPPLAVRLRSGVGTVLRGFRDYLS